MTAINSEDRPTYQTDLVMQMDTEKLLGTALRVIQQQWHELRNTENQIVSPEASMERVRQYLTIETPNFHNEIFGCLFLNTRHFLIAKETLFHGTVDGAAVYPRVVAQRALALNASAVVLFHNHPSGNTQPSDADISLTERLQQALGLLDVRVLDHIITAGGESVSMANKGLI